MPGGPLGLPEIYYGCSIGVFCWGCMFLLENLDEDLYKYMTVYIQAPIRGLNSLTKRSQFSERTPDHLGTDNQRSTV